MEGLGRHRPVPLGHKDVRGWPLFALQTPQRAYLVTPHRVDTRRAVLPFWRTLPSPKSADVFAVASRAKENQQPFRSREDRPLPIVIAVEDLAQVRGGLLITDMLTVPVLSPLGSRCYLVRL